MSKISKSVITFGIIVFLLVIVHNNERCTVHILKQKIVYLALYMRIGRSCKASVRLRYKCEDLAQNMEFL